MPDLWWEAFEDPGLNRTVDRALAGNLDLEAGWYRLRAARAVADGEAGALYPSLDAVFDAAASTDGERDEQTFGLGLVSGYEVDLWGSIGSAVEAEREQARASRADHQTAILTVSAEVTRSWYALAEARNQRRLLDAQVQTNEDVLQLLRARVGAGQTRSVDILRQSQLLASTREERIGADARVRLLEHELGVLSGLPPGSRKLSFDADALPELAPLPDTGLPAELVQRRPDVRRAFHVLQASDQELAAAISARYPRLNLTASLSTTGANVGDLFTDWLASAAGQLLAPIFAGGELSAEVDRTRAVRSQRLAEYGRTVLDALREVEDALVREERQRQTIESLEARAELAEQTYGQLRLEYVNGLSDYLDVLVALTEQQAVRRELLGARLALTEQRIALYRALAGGFELQAPGEELGQLIERKDR